MEGSGNLPGYAYGLIDPSKAHIHLPPPNAPTLPHPPPPPPPPSQEWKYFYPPPGPPGGGPQGGTSSNTLDYQREGGVLSVGDGQKLINQEAGGGMVTVYPLDVVGGGGGYPPLETDERTEHSGVRGFCSAISSVGKMEGNGIGLVGNAVSSPFPLGGQTGAPVYKGGEDSNPLKSGVGGLVDTISSKEAEAAAYERVSGSSESMDLGGSFSETSRGVNELSSSYSGSVSEVESRNDPGLRESSAGGYTPQPPATPQEEVKAAKFSESEEDYDSTPAPSVRREDGRQQFDSSSFSYTENFSGESSMMEGGMSSEGVYDSEGGIATEKTIDVDESKELSDLRAFRQKETGAYKTDAVESGSIYVFGSGEMDQIPTGEDEAEIEIPRNINEMIAGDAVRIFAGGLHNCVLLSYGGVLTFGCNDEGALGRDSKAGNDESIPRLVKISEKIESISCGDSHSAFLTKSGKVYLCGSYRDKMERIGFPDFTDENNVLPCTFIPTLARFSDGVYIEKIASGDDHTVCLDNSGRLWSWGSNEFGQLSFPIASPFDKKKKRELLFPHLVFEGMNGESALQLLKLRDVYCGKCTTFVFTRGEDKVFGCGRNGCGEVGSEAFDLAVDHFEEVSELRNKQIVQVSGGQFFSVALTKDGKVYAWGDANNIGIEREDEATELRNSRRPSLVTFFEEKQIRIGSISSGSDHCLAISDEGVMYSWGSGMNFQLGNGEDTSFAHTPLRLEPKVFSGYRALMAAGGCQHSIALISHTRKVLPPPEELPHMDECLPLKKKFEVAQAEAEDISQPEEEKLLKKRKLADSVDSLPSLTPQSLLKTGGALPPLLPSSLESTVPPSTLMISPTPPFSDSIRTEEYVLMKASSKGKELQSEVVLELTEREKLLTQEVSQQSSSWDREEKLEEGANLGEDEVEVSIYPFFPSAEPPLVAREEGLQAFEDACGGTVCVSEVGGVGGVGNDLEVVGGSSLDVVDFTQVEVPVSPPTQPVKEDTDLQKAEEAGEKGLILPKAERRGKSPLSTTSGKGGSKVVDKASTDKVKPPRKEASSSVNPSGGSQLSTPSGAETAAPLPASMKTVVKTETSRKKAVQNLKKQVAASMKKKKIPAIPEKKMKIALKKSRGSSKKRETVKALKIVTSLIQKKVKSNVKVVKGKKVATPLGGGRKKTPPPKPTPKTLSSKASKAAMRHTRVNPGFRQMMKLDRNTASQWRLLNRIVRKNPPPQIDPDFPFPQGVRLNSSSSLSSLELPSLETFKPRNKGTEKDGRGEVSKDGRGAVSKDGRGAVSKGGKEPVSKDGRGAVSKDGKEPVSKDGRGEVSKDGKEPVSKGGKEPVSKDGRGAVSKDGKEPVSKGGKNTAGQRTTPSLSEALKKPPKKDALKAKTSSDDARLVASSRGGCKAQKVMASRRWRSSDRAYDLDSEKVGDEAPKRREESKKTSPQQKGGGASTVFPLKGGEGKLKKGSSAARGAKLASAKKGGKSVVSTGRKMMRNETQKGRKSVSSKAASKAGSVSSKC